MNSENIYQDIVRRLSAVRRAENSALALSGLLLIAVIALTGTLLALSAEAVLYFPPAIRTILFWMILLALLGAALWWVGRPLLKLAGLLPDERPLDTALRVGNRFPAINDRLRNILQLSQDRNTTELFSSDLIDASFEDARKDIEPLDFTAVAERPPQRLLARILAGVGTVLVLLVVVFPTAYRAAAERLWEYDRSFERPLPFSLLIEPGDREVTKGDSVPVTIQVSGAPQQTITLATKPEGQISYDEVRLTPSSPGTFATTLQSLKSTTQYYAYAGLVKSNEYTLTVVDRPFIKIMRLHLEYPSYSGLTPTDLDDNVGDVTALKGTRVGVTIETNKDLASASVVFNDSSVMALRPDGTKAHGTMPLLRDRSYHVLIADRDGRENAEPIEYSLRVIQDEYPTAVIAVPGQNLDITESESLNMLFSLTDDYGFSQLRLAHKLIQSSYEHPEEDYAYTAVPLPATRSQQLTVPYLWSLASLSLVPEDVVSYYIEVFDNDAISGPKSARSESFTLRLPSLDEVFTDVDKSHDVTIEGMKEALKQADEAKKELEELRQDMLKNPEKLDWQQQKKAGELAKQYQDIHKKLDDVNKRIDATLEEMQKNKLLSQETLEKYQELQQLMQSLDSAELQEAMKKMQEAMMQMNPEALKKAMQNFSFSEENFRKSIERTLDLLKRLQIEQKVDESMKRAEEMMKRQEELQRQTEQTNPDNKQALQELARKQKDVSEQLDQLKRELADLQKKMEEFPTEMPLSEMQQARNQLEQSKLQEQLDSIAQQMQRQQLSQAQQSQQSAMQKMGKFMEQLQQMQQTMRENQQRQIVNEMRKSLQDLLELSKRQEELKDELEKLDPASQRFRDLAQRQMEMMRDLGKVTERMGKLSQKSFGITPEMGKSIGEAMNHMNESMQSLDQRNGTRAGQEQEGSMGALNEAAQQVASALDAMMQGGGAGMGMAGFMQQLQRLSAQQQGINNATKDMNGLTPEQMAEMGRLAGEQGVVRKSLEELAREAANRGELSKMLGDLSSIAREMREVQTDLAQGDVNPETLRKQDRILSRLLDSQRSARERDFEKRRKSEAGKNLVHPGPGQIDLTTQEGRNRLRRDLLKAVEEGYAKDYEALIRKYFEALERSEQQN